MNDSSEFSPSAVGRAPKYVKTRDNLGSVGSIIATSQIDVQIVRLLALHSTLSVRFRNQDLSTLDGSTKQLFLNDINDVLGIKPLRNLLK